MESSRNSFVERIASHFVAEKMWKKKIITILQNMKSDFC